MSKTKISWADSTINPIVGCSHAGTPGCDNCYAQSMARRLANMGLAQYKTVTEGDRKPGHTPFHGWNGSTAFVESELKKPYKWKAPRTIFVGSMGDVFHHSVPFEWVDRVLRMVNDNKRHTFVLLTKRANRMQEYFKGLATPGTGTETARRLLSYPNYADRDHGWHMRYLKGGSMDNLVLGVSVEDQATADERIPVLLQIPAAKRFISLEPMIGPVSIDSGRYHYRFGDPENRFDCGINCVIVGGESGNKARAMNPDWVRLVRDQCAAAEVKFMFKQWSKVVGPGAGTVFGFFDHESGKPMIDGRTHTELAWSVRK